MNESSRQLDCSQGAIAVKWFSAGALFVLLVPVISVLGRGDSWLSLLPVGRDLGLRPWLERELGPLNPRDPIGHDGQIYFAIARDPLGRRGVPALLAGSDDHAPAYRYRRILFPLLSGCFGLAPARVTLCAMVFWVAFGGGLAALAVADLCHLYRLPRWTAMLAIVNLGVLLGAKVLATEPLALGLGCCGLALWRREHLAGAICCFAASGLTKEVTLLIPWALAIWLAFSGKRKQAFFVVLLSTAPIALWAVWLEFNLGGGETPLKNISLPLVGIGRAVTLWLDSNADTTTGDIACGVFALIMLTVATVVALRCSGAPHLRLHILSWLLLAVLLSELVWGRSTNALRVLSPLWTLMVLGMGSIQKERSRSEASR